MFLRREPSAVTCAGGFDYNWWLSYCCNSQISLPTLDGGRAMGEPVSSVCNISSCPAGKYQCVDAYDCPAGKHKMARSCLGGGPNCLYSLTTRDEGAVLMEVERSLCCSDSALTIGIKTLPVPRNHRTASASSGTLASQEAPSRSGTSG
jgi:hypothetical protein